jgi:DNA-binding CsgD family transcriptional regulator/PAS domain-containing protein
MMIAPRSHLGNSRFDAFLHALYSSISPAEVQSTCAKFAGDLVPAHAYGWYQFNGGTREPSILSARGVSDRFLARYESEGRSRDPLFKRVENELCTVCSDFDLSANERRAFRFQTEISSGCVVRAIEAPILVAGELIGTLNVARDGRDRRFTRDDAERVTLIAGHASNAIARIRRESEIITRSILVEEALDALSLPVIVTDLRGNIVFANGAANRLLNNPELAVELTLRETAQVLLENGERLATGFVRHSSTLPAGLTVRSSRVESASAIVTLIHDAPTSIKRPLSLLSRREREIAKFVVRGFTNVQIATASSISHNTVKRHLKHVFEKLNVDSRAELAAIIAGVDAAAAYGDAAFAAHLKPAKEC